MPKLKEKYLYGEEVPINNASNSMTPSYNVAVAEVQFYLSSPFNFESVRPTILQLYHGRKNQTFTFQEGKINFLTCQRQSQKADRIRRTRRTPHSTPR